MFYTNGFLNKQRLAHGPLKNWHRKKILKSYFSETFELITPVAALQIKPFPESPVLSTALTVYSNDTPVEEKPKKSAKGTKGTKSTQKKFRIAAKNLFLTYSPCDLLPQQIFNQISQKFPGLKIKEYIIAREWNQERTQCHIHAYLEFNAKLDVKTSSTLDVIQTDGKIIHGNYKAVKKNQPYLYEYLKKQSPEECISSPAYSNLTDAQGNFFNNHWELCVYLAEKNEVEKAMLILKEKEPQKYALSHTSIRASLEELSENKKLTPALKYPYESFIAPNQLIHALNSTVTVSLMLQGLSSTGKSEFTKAFLKKKNKVALWVQNFDALRKFDAKIHQAIVFDDFDWSTVKNDVVRLNLLEYNNSRTFETKFISTIIPAGIQKIILTNKSFADLSLDMAPEHKRRLNIINIKGVKLYGDKNKILSAVDFNIELQKYNSETYTYDVWEERPDYSTQDFLSEENFNQNLIISADTTFIPEK